MLTFIILGSIPIIFLKITVTTVTTVTPFRIGNLHLKTRTYVKTATYVRIRPYGRIYQAIHTYVQEETSVRDKGPFLPSAPSNSQSSGFTCFVY